MSDTNIDQVSPVNEGEGDKKKNGRQGEGGGRPTKFTPKMYKQVTELCLLGYSNAKLADFFDVAPSTITEWSQSDPKFSNALADGRENADGKVAKTLLQRAVGYTYKEETFELIDVTTVDIEGNISKEPGVRKKTVKKHMAGDVTAQMKWLTNKAGWKDRQDVNVTGEMVNHNVEVTAEEAARIKKDLESQF